MENLSKGDRSNITSAESVSKTSWIAQIFETEEDGIFEPPPGMKVRILRCILSKGNAKDIAGYLVYMCYMAMLLCVVTMVLSVIGRQTFILHSSTGIYENASFIMLDRGWTTTTGPSTGGVRGEVRIFTAPGVAGLDEINALTRVSLSAMNLIHALPLTLSLWFLSRVFRNIKKGRIFTEKTAHCLLYYALIQIVMSFFVPLLQFIIVVSTNRFTNSHISFLTGDTIFVSFAIHLAVLVVACIIHHGAGLQNKLRDNNHLEEDATECKTSPEHDLG